MIYDLFLTLDFPPEQGGVARYYDAVLRELPERMFTVLAPQHMQSNTYQPPLNIVLQRVTLLGPRWLWPRWLPLLARVVWKVARARPTLMHVGQVLPVGTVALFVKRLFGIPYIVYTHGLDVVNARNQPRRRRIAQRVLRGAAAVTVNSSFTESVVRELAGPTATIIRLFPGCTLTSATISDREQRNFLQEQRLMDKRIVLSVARLVSRKGIATTLRAFARVARTIPNAVSVIVGDGPERANLEHLAGELGLANRIRFTGAVSDDELVKWFAACDVFLLVPTTLGGSDVEGFGIVYLEAGAFGKPVVASRTGGVIDAVQDGVTGLIVPPDNPEATADAIVRLLTDRSLAERLGGQGRGVVRETGSWAYRTRTLKGWLATFAPSS